MPVLRDLSVICDMHPKSWTQQKGAYFMEKKQQNTQKYDEIFKKEVILDIVNNGLSIHAAVR